MQRIQALVLAVLFMAGGTYYFLQVQFVNPYPVLCNLVSQKIFLSNSQLSSWKNICHSRSQWVTPWTDKKLILKDMNYVLSLLRVSHLEVYNPNQVKKIWQGESAETGIDSDFVESELVIFYVHPQSPAAKLGLQKGDVIKAINGEQPNPWDAQSLSGDYQISRGGRDKIFKLKTGFFVRIENLSFEKISLKKAVVRIPSFRAEFFENEVMKSLSEKLKNTEQLVVDLRGNIGGNFVSGLRFLSLFICTSELVGELLRPRSSNQLKMALADTLKDESQLKIFETHQKIELKTFNSTFCYRGKIAVLVDNKTASVAEFVAQSLKEFRASPLLGSPSRGQLLVGVWYPFFELAPGVELSIPEAYFQSRNNRKIEGEGVELDKLLDYKLSEMQKGADSWILAAFKVLSP